MGRDNDLLFVYDGWNVVLVLSGNDSNAVETRYTWGLDMGRLSSQNRDRKRAADYKKTPDPFPALRQRRISDVFKALVRVSLVSCGVVLVTLRREAEKEAAEGISLIIDIVVILDVNNGGHR